MKNKQNKYKTGKSSLEFVFYFSVCFDVKIDEIVCIYGE